MENIVIEVVDNCNLIVRANTERYGKNAIMYQDTSLRSCCDYIAQKTGCHKFKVQARAITCSPTLLVPDLPALYAGPPLYKDADGLTVAGIMDVLF